MRKLFVVTLVFLLAGCLSEAPPVSLEELSVPEGFAIELFAEDIDGARSLTLGADGTVFVGSRSPGKVYAVRDGVVHTLVTGLNNPNGVAYKGGSLYVAEIDRVLRYDDVDSLQLSDPVVITDDLPSDSHHGWRYIAFGPDDLLYIAVGAPCNNCDEGDPYNTIHALDVTTGGMTIYARGIRNSVGFTWHPETNELWFTDNGRDWWGDDVPPDELNHAPRSGMHFGYPYCHGNLQDDDFTERSCSEFTAPVQELGPHVAALGMLFYTGDMFPEEYRNQVFIAEHGSWNRRIPIGYRISLVRFGEETSYETFAEGWLKGNDVSGRPVDLLQLEDGSLLLSDDKADKIYKITYRR